jgi:molybdenum cofactor cytidylyltransferase
MPMGHPIVGVLLAAGSGSRYDPGGARLKLLEAAPGAAPASVPMALAALRNLRAVLAVCADAGEGMGRSLACGIRACGDAAGWIVALADMPAVSTATIAAVRDAIARGHDAAAPACRGRRGHPVGFGRACLDELLALSGDAGARSVLAAHPPLLIDVDDPGCLLDIDTPTG